jgi:hypothetical protein
MENGRSGHRLADGRGLRSIFGSLRILTHIGPGVPPSAARLTCGPGRSEADAPASARRRSTASAGFWLSSRTMYVVQGRNGRRSKETGGMPLPRARPDLTSRGGHLMSPARPRRRPFEPRPPLLCLRDLSRLFSFSPTHAEIYSPPVFHSVLLSYSTPATQRRPRQHAATKPIQARQRGASARADARRHWLPGRRLGRYEARGPRAGD